jgi:hemoglobin
MKRHPSLAHLSREHHGALILARLLQNDAPAYKGLPTDTFGKAEYALKFYKEELVKHFETEEKALSLVLGVNDTLDLLVHSITKEHQVLHESFESVKENTKLQEHLDTLGKALEAHIRKEERELFPLIQETCGKELMIAIDKSLSSQIRKDIDTRNDIELLVNVFYAKVLADPLLGYLFQETANMNWSTHFPAMYNFWENVILFTGTYEGNPMNLHKHLHHITPLNETHFDRWNQLFIHTVDGLFQGKKAELAKQRAISISTIIKEKLLAFQKGNS